MPLGPAGRNKAELEQQIRSFRARGRTPIAYALEQAATDLGDSGARTIVLVSDGKDTCQPPSPCSVAQRVAKGGVEMRIQAIGFNVASVSSRARSAWASRPTPTSRSTSQAATTSSSRPRTARRRSSTTPPAGSRTRRRCRSRSSAAGATRRTRRHSRTRPCRRARTRPEEPPSTALLALVGGGLAALGFGAGAVFLWRRRA